MLWLLSIYATEVNWETSAISVYSVTACDCEVFYLQQEQRWFDSSALISTTLPILNDSDSSRLCNAKWAWPTVEPQRTALDGQCYWLQLETCIASPQPYARCAVRSRWQCPLQDVSDPSNELLRYAQTKHTVWQHYSSSESSRYELHASEVSTLTAAADHWPISTTEIRSTVHKGCLKTDPVQLVKCYVSDSLVGE